MRVRTDKRYGTISCTLKSSLKTLPLNKVRRQRVRGARVREGRHRRQCGHLIFNTGIVEYYDHTSRYLKHHGDPSYCEIWIHPLVV